MQDREDQTPQLQRLRSVLSNQLGIVNESIEAVVGMLLFENGDRDLEILLVQRAERSGDPWSGHIGLPGGRIKPSDDSPIEACTREVMEEVGIDLSREGELLGSLAPEFPWNRPELKVQPYIYRLIKRPTVRVGPEIVAAFWVALSQLPKMFRQSEVPTRVGPRVVDSFLVDGRIIWGFTFRILNELLSLRKQPSD